MLDRNTKKVQSKIPSLNDSELVNPKNQGETVTEVQSSSPSLKGGYTIDEEGVLNRYAIEPPISEASYPSSKEKRRYLFLGIAAALFITFILEIAFLAS